MRSVVQQPQHVVQHFYDGLTGWLALWNIAVFNCVMTIKDFKSIQFNSINTVQKQGPPRRLLPLAPSPLCPTYEDVKVQLTLWVLNTPGEQPESRRPLVEWSWFSLSQRLTPPPPASGPTCWASCCQSTSLRAPCVSQCPAGIQEVFQNCGFPGAGMTEWLSSSQLIISKRNACWSSGLSSAKV